MICSVVATSISGCGVCTVCCVVCDSDVNSLPTSDSKLSSQQKKSQVSFILATTESYCDQLIQGCW